MLLVGLTGGIACGKSTVVRMLQEEGVHAVVDCDLIAREVVEPGSGAYRAIVDRFPGVVDEKGGSLNREKLGEIVFKDREARRFLNGVTHWRIGLVLVKRLFWLWLRGESLVILDAPLLYESGLNRICSTTVCVVADQQEQLQRLMDRDGIDESLALLKIEAQMSSEEKAKRSKFKIVNSGTLEETKQQVQVIAKTLKSHPRALWSHRWTIVATVVFVVWGLSKIRF